MISLHPPSIIDGQRLTGDTAEGADASVSTIAPAGNLRLRKAPIAQGISGALRRQALRVSPT